MLFEFSKRASLLLVLSLYISGTPTLAQQNNPNQKSGNNSSEKTLTAAAAIPDVPDFNGQKQFEFGSIEETTLGTAYRERWICQDEPAKIAQWFKDRMTGWEIQTDSPSNMNWIKKDTGSSCMVRVVPTTSKKGKSELTVSSLHRK